MTEIPAVGPTTGGIPPNVAPGAASTGPSWVAPGQSDGGGPARVQPRVEAPTLPAETTVTGWLGWLVFAATMLVMVGGFQLFDGFVALFKDDLYLVRPDGLVVNIDYTVWGWLQLAVGGLLLATGFALLAGRTWARVLAIVVAALNALLQFAFAASYPFWSMLIITVDVIVIYALTAHGGEIKVARDREL
jgi:hypothetical protein